MAIDIDEVAKAAVNAIPARAEFDAEGREEALRVVSAAVMGLYPDHFNTQEIVERIGGLENGYGCWLEWLRDAVTAGLDTLGDGYDERSKGRIEGAFVMTVRLLFELEKHKYGQGEPLRYEDQAK